MSETAYAPDDFVYVDPTARKAVGLVEWDKDGNPVPKEWPYPENKDSDSDDASNNDKTKRRPVRKKKRTRYYPWGSYKTMSKLYKLEGKIKDKDTEDYIALDTAIGNLQEDPFWD